MEAKEKASKKQRAAIIALVAVFVIGMGIALYITNTPSSPSSPAEAAAEEAGGDVAVEEITESGPLAGDQAEEADGNEINDVTGSAPGADDGANESGGLGE
jgi:hypothetical protein